MEKKISFYWVPIHGPNRRKFSLPKNTTSHNWMCGPCLISALFITWPISHVETKLSDDSVLVCCPHKCISYSLTPCQLVIIWVVLSVRASGEESMLGQTSTLIPEPEGLRNSPLKRIHFNVFIPQPQGRSCYPQIMISPHYMIAQETQGTQTIAADNRN